MRQNKNVFSIQNIFLFIITAASFALALFEYIITPKNSIIEGIIDLILFIPFVIIIVINYLAIKYQDKLTIYKKILIYVANIVIIVFFQLYLGVAIMLVLDFGRAARYEEYEQPQIQREIRENLFPEQLPENANEIKRFEGRIAGGQAKIKYLRFKINIDYILKEIYDIGFEGVEDPSNDITQYSYQHQFLTNNGKEDIRGFKFYIKEYAPRNSKDITYEKGIAANFDTCEIMYYEISPE